MRVLFRRPFSARHQPELGEKVRLHIKRYIIADQVELEDVTATTAAIGLEGPGTAAVLAALGAPVADLEGPAYSHAPWGESTVAAVTETGQPGVRIFCPADRFGALVSQLEGAGAVAASAADARLVRIENGKPRYGEDIRETSELPQETQQMHAVSFNKGCYLGQEIVERIRAQGRVNKKLMRVVLEGEAPAAGSKVTVDGADAEVTSAIVSPESGEAVVLAYVRQR